MNDDRRIRLALIDDHPLFRDGLATLLTAQPNLNLIASVPSVAEFDRALVDCDLILLDLGLPGLSGADAVAHLRKAQHRVLVISAASQRSDVLAAISAGAAGYLSKAADADEVLWAIETVAGGGTFVSPTLASYLLAEAAEIPLTAREREILELVAEGETDKDIAELLTISPATVASHLERIRNKTGRRRRTELTRYAVERGIVRNER